MKTLISSICVVLTLATSAWAQCGSCGSTAPGLPYPLVDWRFVNGGALPQTHYYAMTDDDLEVTIEDGSRLNLTPNEIHIVLRSRVDWRKEIVAWSSCNGRAGTIATEGSFRGPVSMRLNRNNCSADTVILRKGEFLVGMVDKYNMDTDFFWRMWAGKIITFDWTGDWPSGTRIYPPAWSFFFPGISLDTNPDQGVLYDTDGKADLAVWREGPWWGTTADWFVINSSTGSGSVKQFGRPRDRPVPFDYDFDGRIDMAVWRPSTGQWRIVNSFTGVTRVVSWGRNGDVPAPGDYDGDGKADFCFWRPLTGTWHIQHFTGVETTIQWGSDPEMAVQADYDGDGRTDRAVWNFGTGMWSILTSPPRRDLVEGSGGTPVPADYDGDGKTDLATWSSSTGTWRVRNSATDTKTEMQWGMWGDLPVAKDYDGDNKADLGVWRPSTGQWFIIKSSDGGVIVSQLGQWGDFPVPAK